MYKRAELNVEVGDASCGPVVEKFTAIPDPIATVDVKSVVLVSAEVVGVAYVLVTFPTNVRSVPIGDVPAVCALQMPLKIWLQLRRNAGSRLGPYRRRRNSSRPHGGSMFALTRQKPRTAHSNPFLSVEICT